jgi:putative hemolysin
MSFLPETRKESSRKEELPFSIVFASNTEDICRAQKLRYEVFVQEMGAKLACPNGLESDIFDPYCEHLLVIDQRKNLIVGYYRLLTEEGARKAGSFYSETEFDLQRLRQKGRMLELGRACIHKDYRNGAVLALLWSGLAKFLQDHPADFLVGCASVPLLEDDSLAWTWHYLQTHHGAPPDWQVVPKHPYDVTLKEPPPGWQPALSPLFRGYLKIGAKVCSAPAWDEIFGVADFLLLMPIKELNFRYVRHFITRL